MDFTSHGAERIYDRTKMRPEDVLSIVSDGVGVDLGMSSNDGYRYFLFYSPPDGCTKIAVVSGDRACLVSVWEATYHIPSELKRVTKKMKHQARKILQDYVFSKLKKSPKPA